MSKFLNACLHLLSELGKIVIVSAMAYTFALGTAYDALIDEIETAFEKRLDNGGEKMARERYVEDLCLYGKVMTECGDMCVLCKRLRCCLSIGLIMYLFKCLRFVDGNGAR